MYPQGIYPLQIGISSIVFQHTCEIPQVFSKYRMAAWVYFVKYFYKIYTIDPLIINLVETVDPVYDFIWVITSSQYLNWNSYFCYTTVWWCVVLDLFWLMKAIEALSARWSLPCVCVRLRLLLKKWIYLLLQMSVCLPFTYGMDKYLQRIIAKNNALIISCTSAEVRCVVWLIQ